MTAADAARLWREGKREECKEWCEWGQSKVPPNIAFRPEADRLKMGRCARTAAVALALGHPLFVGLQDDELESFLRYMEGSNE